MPTPRVALHKNAEPAVEGVRFSGGRPRLDGRHSLMAGGRPNCSAPAFRPLKPLTLTGTAIIRLRARALRQRARLLSRHRSLKAATGHSVNIQPAPSPPRMRRARPTLPSCSARSAARRQTEGTPASITQRQLRWSDDNYDPMITTIYSRRPDNIVVNDRVTFLREATRRTRQLTLSTA